jgi:large subunit ribosomal protein L24
LAGRIRRGDEVEIISGVDAGKRGRVLKVFPERSRALVEGVNLVKRHTRPNQNNQQGGIVEQEAPVHLAKLMPIDPKSGEPTRVRSEQLADGSRVRVATRSGEHLPEPSE